MNGRAKQVALGGVLTALALLLGGVERLLPPIAGALPGVKLGLSNLPVIVALYMCGPGMALCVSVARALLGGLLFGGPTALLYGTCGALLAWASMCAARRVKALGVAGVSLVGGVCHNVGQWLVALWMMRGVGLWSLLPLLLASGAVSGFVIGLVASWVMARLEKVPPSAWRQ